MGGMGTIHFDIEDLFKVWTFSGLFETLLAFNQTIQNLSR